MLKVFIVGKYKDSIKQIESLFSKVQSEAAVVGAESDDQKALELIDELSPDVLIFALSGGDSSILSIARRIYTLRPKISTVILSNQVDEDLYEQAVQCRAKYVGLYPQNAEEFIEKLVELYNQESERVKAISDNKDAHMASSSVIGVYSTKGGIGKTTIATNLAVSLAKFQKSVVLIDLDCEFGDVSSCLDITPKKTIENIISEYGTAISINELELCMDIHPSGVRVISAPKSPEVASLVEVPYVLKIISILKTYYDYVILDMPAGFRSDGFQSDIFTEAVNQIYFVINTEIATIRAAKTAVDLFNVMQLKHKLRIIVNRVDKQNIISIAELKKVIDCRVVAEIPSDYRNVSSALNRSIPIVTAYPPSRHPVSKELEHLAMYALSKNDEFDLVDIPAKKRDKAYQDIATIPKPIKSMAKKKKGLFGR